MTTGQYLLVGTPVALTVEVRVPRRVPRSRTPLALALGAAPAVPLPLTPPATAADAYTVTPLKFTVRAGGRACTVDADLYRPAGVDRDHPAPAVLGTNGFGGSKTDGSTDTIGKAFAQRGYGSLIYSGLGFGRSGCLVSLDDPDIDGAAASQLVDFLGGTRAADDGTTADYVTRDAPGDPRVGMIGGSYGGAVQLATAAVDHRLDALVPMITWNDLAYSLDPSNAVGSGGVPGVFKWQWTNGFYLRGEGQPLLQPSLDPSRINSLACLHFVTEACRTVHTLNSGSYPADRTAELLTFAHRVSPVSYLHRVDPPTLLVQGQADTLFNLNEATATYRTLKAQGRRILAWFGRHLRKQTHVDTGPAFAYYRDWITDPDRTYATAGDLPAAGRTLYLSGDGTLVDQRGKVARGSRGHTNWLIPTSHSESSLSGLIGLRDSPPRDTKGTCLGWTSAPLEDPLDVVGAPRATLKVVSPKAERTHNSADAADKLVLFAKLYDVAPDGTRTLVRRLVAPVRVPDVTKSFTVTLPGIVHRYETGHRLRFVIAASDDAYFGNRGIKPVTVVSGPRDTGVLRLPVAGP